MRGPSLSTLLLLAAALPADGSSDFPRGVHAFFYLWYGNPETDGAYKHWNHELLPHWNEHTRKQYPIDVRFSPPSNIHAPFYPQRGPYSSSDPETLRAQFAEMKAASIEVAVVSWWGRPDQPGTSDTQGVSTDALIPIVLAAADRVGMKISFHLEPYRDRSAATVRLDLAHIHEKYGASKALFRHAGKPLFYVYDSYHIKAQEWANVLSKTGPDSVRGTDLDGTFLGLWLDARDGEDLLAGGFDGSYTYFASEFFSHGSTPSQWSSMARWSQQNSLLFVPSVGPGYKDDGIRPWNRHNTKRREGGRYYDRMWESAIASAPNIISITSYNEWGEGTQIEPAVSKRRTIDPAHASSDHNNHMDEDTLRKLDLGDSYEDYGDNPHFYLDKTRSWALKWTESQSPSQGAGLGREL